MLRIQIVILAILWSFSALGQQAGDRNSNYIIPETYSRIHQQGEQSLLHKKYKEAIRAFKKVLKKYPDFPPALRSAGACYELMGDFEEASGYYIKALEAHPYFSRAMYYEVGNIQYRRGHYEEAMQYYARFDSLLREDPNQFTYNGFEELKIEKVYSEKLEASVRACNIAMDSIRFWNISGVENIGPTINTKADEYFPFLTNDGNTIFYTSRKDQFADENLFVSSRPRGEWKAGNKVNDFNSGQNEGMTTLVRDGRNLYFTACQREQVLGTCDIWQASINGEEISNTQPAAGFVNSASWESQASISCDGSLLFFASNREGGFGGTDIWKSTRLADGSWSEPVNMGNRINTSGDEEAPFITNDGNVLYFSSTGHIGLGEQDIFMARQLAENEWSLPVNLGMPVNSAYRELGFFLSANGQTGYFASDRSGGEGGMDIYRFDVPEMLSSDPITYVEGYVKDSLTRLPIQAKVYFKDRSPVQTDEEGRFFLCVPANDTLEVEIVHEDYHRYYNIIPVPKWENVTFYHVNLLMDPLFHLPVYNDELNVEATMVSLKSPFDNKLKHNILFEFDEDDLDVESIRALDDFISSYLQGNPVETLEIIGYADEIGNDSYNLRLSEKRARAVGVYLKNKGIQVDNIYIEGKGEVVNTNPAWKNRRVEIVVQLIQ